MGVNDRARDEKDAKAQKRSELLKVDGLDLIQQLEQRLEAQGQDFRKLVIKKTGDWGWVSTVLSVTDGGGPKVCFCDGPSILEALGSLKRKLETNSVRWQVDKFA